ncbi:probable mannan endo-1,4-beta-mannosidase 1 at N-terminal half [Coccomyxa sp. Obi]|nr:probable mannan endo-1,4-beta-mannosidase 1 at N-terminal half [Coccomyxa sp. Obi]
MAQSCNTRKILWWLLFANFPFSSPSEAAAANFIRVQSGVFVDGSCKDFKFSGYNAWQVIETALDMCCGGHSALVTQFQDAARNGLTVVRMFGFPVQEGFNLQLAPGVYNETAFRGMDMVIAEAAKQGLRLVIAFANNWAYNDLQTDWKCAYTNWTTTAKDCNDFYTDVNVIKLYKQHVKKVLKRVNSVTGVAYANDPTILGWNLMNEPRNEHKKGATELQSWIKKVAPFVKGQAPNQLLTVGTEGFYQASNCAAPKLNPVPAGWPLMTGQDHLPNHALPSIDYAAIHLWPDVWSQSSPPWGLRWIQAHAENSALLGKPLVIEEFGKFVGGIYDKQHTETAARQLAYYKKVYAEVSKSVFGSGAIKGILFWRWKAADPTIELGTDDQAATLATDGKVFQEVIKPFSKRVAKLALDTSRPVVKGCVLANLVTTPATLVVGSQPELQPPPLASTSGAAVQSAQLAAESGTDVHSAPVTATSDPALQSAAAAAKSDAAVQSAAAAAKSDAAVQSAAVAARSDEAVQSAAAAARSDAAVQSAAAAAKSDEAAQSAAVAAGVAPGDEVGKTPALVPPPPAAVGQAASAAHPAATAGVQGSEAMAVLAGAAPKRLDEQGSADPAAAVSAPVKLVLPQAAAGRKLRAAAATQPLVEAQMAATDDVGDSAALARFMQQSTFSTPPGITANNINSKVVCASAAAASTPAAAAG